MKRLSSIDINDRGDADFESLNEVEKNLYVLMLFTHLHEMEGMTHFYSHQIHHLPRLHEFIKLIDAPNQQSIQDITEHIRSIAGDDWDVDAYFRKRTDEDMAILNSLDDEYYSKMPAMWESARKYLFDTHNAEFD